MKIELSKYRNFLYSKLGIPIRLFSGFKKAPIQFITEKQEWSIHMDGVNITYQINKNKNKEMAQISNFPFIFANKIVHFGSQYMWTKWENFITKNNKYVSTFYHGKHQDGKYVSEHINKFIESSSKLSKIVTGSTLIEKRLLK